MPPRSLTITALLLGATIGAGLAIRFAHIGLPSGVAKYGGSMLWALMFYWIVSALWPSGRVVPAALFAAGMTAAIEFFKLVHAPVLDAFRLTLPGVLLLGRVFSLWDIAAYWLAITIGAWADWRLCEAVRRS
jgi:Protein of unknown function (DUF2809)